jgi:hypothetical protein
MRSFKQWLVLSRIQHGVTGKYHEAGETVELGHLSKDELAGLAAKGIIREVTEHGTDHGRDQRQVV